MQVTVNAEGRMYCATADVTRACPVVINNVMSLLMYSVF